MLFGFAFSIEMSCNIPPVS